MRVRTGKCGSWGITKPMSKTSPALQSVLFLPDTHCPYHDERAFGLVEQAARKIKPDIIVLCGDFADFYAVSSHVKDPARRMTFEDEVVAVRNLLRRVEFWGAKRKLYLMGNHEDRLARFIAGQAREMHGIVTVDSLFGLTDHGWAVTPYKSHATIGKLYVTHDLGKSGATAVKDASASFQDNVVIGHIHRMLYMIEGNVKGKPHVAASFGWLGDAGKTDYMYQVRAARDWALGFGIGYMEPSGVVHLQPVPIVQYKCVVHGQLLTA